MLKTIDVELKGIAPLIMHNGQLADPMNEFVREMKKITRKPAKQKTDADHIELARLEFLGGLYLDEDKEPCIPGENLEAMLIEAARKQRLGKQAEAAIICDGMFPLIYDGPRDPKALWEDGRFRFTKGAKPTGQGRVMRTRPIFRSWSLLFTLAFDDSVIDEAQVRDMLVIAQGMGLGDWTPRHGRFEASA
jgi:hypothetical protein